jgi:uncharacterized membrane protein
MESAAISHYLCHSASVILKGGGIAVVLPLAGAFLCALPVPSTAALITSTLVIEYGAAPIGIALGLPPAFVLYVLVCCALGVTLALFEIFDTMAEHSDRVLRFLKRSEERAKQSQVLSRYGVYGLIPCVLTLGFYVCPPVSWVLGWRRDVSVFMILAGYTAGTALLILGTIGMSGLFVYG